MPTEQQVRNDGNGLDTRRLLSTLMAVKKEDFSVRLPVDNTGAVGKIYDTFNDILDLSKIESGTVDVEVGPVAFTDLRDYVERTFRPVAEGSG